MKLYNILKDDNCLYCNKGIKGEKKYNWNFVDDVFCINLKEREDRYRQASEQFHRVGLCRKVKFYRVDRPSQLTLFEKNIPLINRGEYGCWTSHQNIYKYIKDKKKKDSKDGKIDYTLIFEDDVVFVDFDLEKIKEAFARLPENWDIFFLGHAPIFCYPLFWSDLSLIKTWSTSTHAYIINKDFSDRLSSIDYTDWNYVNGPAGIDAYFLKYGNLYAYYPQVAFQSGSPSDISLSNPYSNKNTNKRGNYIIRDKIRERLVLLISVTIIILLSLLIYIIPTLTFRFS